jgi:hypothetical protein
VGVADGFIDMQIDLFIFAIPPQLFDEDIVPPPSRPIHTEGLAGERTALIRVEDLRMAIPGDGACTASTQQSLVNVLDSLRDNTRRLVPSRSAQRDTPPSRIGMSMISMAST